MIKKPSFKAFAAAACFGATSLIATVPASAQSLQDVLNAVRQDSNQISRENEQRLREFRQATAEQEQSMASLRAELRQAEARGQALQREFDANELELSALQTQLETEAGDFGLLLGQFRQAAQESQPILRNSLASAEYPGRAQELADIAQARTLPTRADLDKLPKAILLEMIAQSEVKAFEADVQNLGGGGETETAEVFRVGVFNAATVNGNRFVEMGSDGLVAFPKQPPASFANAMSRLINAGDTDVVAAPLDPSKGNLFDTYGKLPTFGDRIEDGGLVGRIIMFIGLVGVVLGLFKFVSLLLMGMSMGGTRKSKEAGDGNPLARIFQTYEDHRKDKIETLELKLDEQILKETPKIERLNDIVKVLASVAPLLGLLGTVIGMIITFTAITIYGAGDPQLMADGISTALMTTVMGLCAAIPLLLIHAIISAQARSAQQVLDEQAAGLVAERAEKDGVAA